MTRIETLEKELERVCGTYESDCTRCPKQKECEEYARLLRVESATPEEKRSLILSDIKNLSRLEKIADRAERSYERNPESESAEKAFDLAYESQFNQMEIVVSEICMLSHIERKVARKILCTKRKDLIALFS